MKIKLPEKWFFTVEQLAARWEVDPLEIEHLAETGQLTKRDKMAVLEGGANAEYTFFNLNLSPFGTDFDLMPCSGGLGACVDGVSFGREVRVDIFLDEETRQLPAAARMNRVQEFIDSSFPDSQVIVFAVEDVLKFERRYAASKGELAGSIDERPQNIRDESLLSVIAALLAQWPSGKLPSGKDLEKAAQSIGLKISDDTIRKALKAAQDIAPSLPA